MLTLPLLFSCSSDDDKLESSGISYFDENIVNYWDMVYPPQGESYPYSYYAYQINDDGTFKVDYVVLDAYGANYIEKSKFTGGTYKMILPDHLIFEFENGKTIHYQIEFLNEDNLDLVDDNGIRLHYGF